MSLRYQIPGRSTGSNLPILGFGEGQIVDGSLLYVEPARDGFTAVPKAGSSFTNFAKGPLSSLASVPMSDCDAVMRSIGAGVNGRFELTSAGGLHGFFNLAAGATYPTEYWDLLFPPALIAYIRANPTHTYFADAVIRSTADPLKAGSPGNIDYLVGIADGYAADGVFFGFKNQCDSDLTLSNNSLVWPAASWAPAVLSADRTVIEPAPVVSHPRVSFTDRVPVGFTETAEGAVRWGGPRQNGAHIAGGQGFIFYSAYVEDCDVSGRTAAAAKAWRQDQVAADFAPGGRYYGDTWTDPATVAW